MLATSAHYEADAFTVVSALERTSFLRRLDTLAGQGVSEADLAELRGLVEEHAPLSRQEIDKIAAIEAADIPRCEGWTGFFIETVTDHVVWGARPTGVVNGQQGEWLIAMADRCGTLGAFGALVNVLAESHRVPMWFLAAVRARAARGVPGAATALAAVA